MKNLPAIVKILFVIILCSLLGMFGGFYLLKYQLSEIVESRIEENNTPSPSPSPFPDPTFTFHDHVYAYALFDATDRTVSLIENFSGGKNNAKTLHDKNECLFSINTGFYDTDKNPIGLWDDGSGKAKGVSKTSLLFNGYIGVGKDGKPFITNGEPSSYKLVVQTGPLLVSEGKALPLVIKNDEYARRMVAAIEKNGTLMFMAIFDPESVYSGPLLSDVPEILKVLEEKMSYSFQHAINLDGGSASSFISPERTLSELTPIGSMFCIK